VKEIVKDDTSTLLAIGVLVSIVASLTHEAIGHGMGCLVDNGRITLMTFLVFRCAGAGTIADGAGPIAVLIVGCIAMAMAMAYGLRSRVTISRLFLLNLAATSLFWVGGQAMEEAFNGSDDWGHVAKDLGWSDHWHWILGIIGVIGYVITMRIASHLSKVLAGGRPERLLLPYVGAIVSAVALGAFWHGGRMASAYDALLSFGVAPVGYLVIAKRVGRGDPLPDGITRSVKFLVAVAVIWLVFAATIAQGLGALS
jgi:hypothetical protein